MRTELSSGSRATARGYETEVGRTPGVLGILGAGAAEICVAALSDQPSYDVVAE